ncbi:MAG: protein kinase, partial [Myxococcales bacterium]|nr:protein kinase [Myxococcales bacterium]
MPRAGQIIGTQLRLVAPLDGGAMGSVWIADHRTLKTQVAVKFVGDRLEAEDPAAIQRFRHEAAASARIKSPHVAQVFDHDTTEDGAPYIVMELLEGETLRKRLDRSRLSVHEAVILVTHVSRALARAHAVGVIHRDI